MYTQTYDHYEDGWLSRIMNSTLGMPSQALLRLARALQEEDVDVFSRRGILDPALIPFAGGFFSQQHAVSGRETVQIVEKATGMDLDEDSMLTQFTTSILTDPLAFLGAGAATRFGAKAMKARGLLGGQAKALGGGADTAEQFVKRAEDVLAKGGRFAESGKGRQLRKLIGSMKRDLAKKPDVAKKSMREVAEMGKQTVARLHLPLISRVGLNVPAITGKFKDALTKPIRFTLSEPLNVGRVGLKAAEKPIRKLADYGKSKGGQQAFAINQSIGENLVGLATMIPRSAASVFHTAAEVLTLPIAVGTGLTKRMEDAFQIRSTYGAALKSLWTSSDEQFEAARRELSEATARPVDKPALEKAKMYKERWIKGEETRVENELALVDEGLKRTKELDNRILRRLSRKYKIDYAKIRERYNDPANWPDEGMYPKGSMVLSKVRKDALRVDAAGRPRDLEKYRPHVYGREAQPRVPFNTFWAMALKDAIEEAGVRRMSKTSDEVVELNTAIEKATGAFEVREILMRAFQGNKGLVDGLLENASRHVNDEFNYIEALSRMGTGELDILVDLKGYVPIEKGTGLLGSLKTPWVRQFAVDYAKADDLTQPELMTKKVFDTANSIGNALRKAFRGESGVVDVEDALKDLKAFSNSTSRGLQEFAGQLGVMAHRLAEESDLENGAQDVYDIFRVMYNIMPQEDDTLEMTKVLRALKDSPEELVRHIEDYTARIETAAKYASGETDDLFQEAYKHLYEGLYGEKVVKDQVRDHMRGLYRSLTSVRGIARDIATVTKNKGATRKELSDLTKRVRTLQVLERQSGGLLGKDLKELTAGLARIREIRKALKGGDEYITQLKNRVTEHVADVAQYQQALREGILNRGRQMVGGGKAVKIFDDMNDALMRMNSDNLRLARSLGLLPEGIQPFAYVPRVVSAATRAKFDELTNRGGFDASVSQILKTAGSRARQMGYLDDLQLEKLHMDLSKHLVKPEVDSLAREMGELLGQMGRFTDNVAAAIVSRQSQYRGFQDTGDMIDTLIGSPSAETLERMGLVIPQDAVGGIVGGKLVELKKRDLLYAGFRTEDPDQVTPEMIREAARRAQRRARRKPKLEQGPAKVELTEEEWNKRLAKYGPRRFRGPEAEKNHNRVVKALESNEPLDTPVTVSGEYSLIDANGKPMKLLERKPQTVATYTAVVETPDGRMVEIPLGEAREAQLVVALAGDQGETVGESWAARIAHGEAPEILGTDTMDLDGLATRLAEVEDFRPNVVFGRDDTIRAITESTQKEVQSSVPAIELYDVIHRVMKMGVTTGNASFHTVTLSSAVPMALANGQSLKNITKGTAMAAALIWRTPRMDSANRRLQSYLGPKELGGGYLSFAPYAQAGAILGAGYAVDEAREATGLHSGEEASLFGNLAKFTAAVRFFSAAGGQTLLRSGTLSALDPRAYKAVGASSAEDLHQVNTSSGTYTMREIMGVFARYGGFNTFVGEGTSRLAAESNELRDLVLNEKSTYANIMDAISAAGQQSEITARLSVFFGFLDSGLTPAQAARKTTTSMFDYNAITPFEQAWMKRLSSFYTYGRKILENTTENYLKNPSNIQVMSHLVYGQGGQASELFGEEYELTTSRGGLTARWGDKEFSLGRFLPQLDVVQAMAYGYELFGSGYQALAAEKAGIDDPEFQFRDAAAKRIAESNIRTSMFWGSWKRDQFQDFRYADLQRPSILGGNLVLSPLMRAAGSPEGFSEVLEDYMTQGLVMKEIFSESIGSPSEDPKTPKDKWTDSVLGAVGFRTPEQQARTREWANNRQKIITTELNRLLKSETLADVDRMEIYELLERVNAKYSYSDF